MSNFIPSNDWNFGWRRKCYGQYASATLLDIEEESQNRIITLWPPFPRSIHGVTDGDEIVKIVVKFYKLCATTYLATFNPRKNLAISWSLLCHGRPRARTMHKPSISSSIELWTRNEKKKKRKNKNIQIKGDETQNSIEIFPILFTTSAFFDRCGEKQRRRAEHANR